MSWWEVLLAVFGAGGIGYLIIDKLFARRADVAAAKDQEISNASQIAKLYNEIDEIVERKTAPIRDEMEEVKQELRGSRADLAELRQHWCCYREDCTDRMLIPTSSASKGEEQQLLLGNQLDPPTESVI